MKPSEYLYNKDFMVLNDTYKLKIIDKLDKQFIDREELKKKIKKIFRNNVQDGNVRDGCMDYYDLDIEEKILELLK